MKFIEDIKKLLHIGGDHVGRVLVLDGADVVGHRVVERLIDAGYTDNLRVGMRTMRTVAEHHAGMELIPFKFEDESAYDDALKGITTVFVTLPLQPDFDKHFLPFIDAVKRNHVKRVVKLSFYHAIKPKAEHPSLHFGDPDYVKAHDGFHDVPFVHAHALCDGDLVVRKELEVTLLFASHLMSNVFRYGLERKALKEHHELYGASCGKVVNYVSPNDVADVAVRAICEKGFHRQTFTLTGPPAITDEGVAALLSNQLGTSITYVEKPLDFFSKDMAALERIKATGIEEQFPKGDIHKALGRDPETFVDYLKATARMTPVEQEAMSVHTEHHCLTATEEEEKTEEIEPTDTEVEVTEKVPAPLDQAQPTAGLAQ